MTRLTKTWLLLGMFVITAAIYRLSPVPQVYDSRYSVLVSEMLVHRRTFDLSSALRTQDTVPLAYQLERKGDAVFYLYPPGTPLLTVPSVPLFNAVGMSALTPAGVYDPVGEVRIQRTLAALMTAASVTLLLSMALRFTTPPRALVLAVAVAFGTSFWSTASRALWSQTTEVLLLSGALWLLVTPPAQRTWPWSILMGSLLGWLYITRPTAAISIVAILAYLLCAQRRRLLVVAPVALAWLGSFVAWSMWMYNAWRPPYYAMSLTGNGVVTAALGQLFSPSRGLLVFTPWLIVLVAMLVHFRRSLPSTALVVTALATILGHGILIAHWDMWWFGHCFGPRGFLDVVPWMALLGAISLAAAPSAASLKPVALAVAGLLGIASVVIHAQGALSSRAMAWNAAPADVDQHTERLWDWSDPQCLAGFFARARAPRRAPPPIDALPARR